MYKNKSITNHSIKPFTWEELLSYVEEARGGRPGSNDALDTIARKIRANIAAGKKIFRDREIRARRAS